MFLDFSKINVKAGKGGNGVISFRREKYVEKGGPDGGDGGKGGDVILVSSNSKTTLVDFRYQKHFKAENGVNGKGKNMHGRCGKDLIIEVPIGTVVRRGDNKEIIADLDEIDKKVIVAKGGIGGKGNARFKSSINNAPQIAEQGVEGDKLWIELELKLLSDVAIIGMPNAGKSTLISVVSNAKPKIADYPFTTLNPNLGVVRVDESSSLVMSDIPGLIEGASENAGLGHRFLRHIERSKVLLHLVDPISQDPTNDYEIIRKELEKYSPILAEKEEVVVVSKSETLNEEQKDKIKAEFQSIDIEIKFISSVSREGIDDIIRTLYEKKEKVDSQMPEKKEEDIEVFSITESEDKIISIEKEDGIYYVNGKHIERLVQKTPLGNELSLERLQMQLEKAGVFKALKEKGINEGDEVDIAGFRFDYFE
ncbi:MAG: hypothetical protein C0601_13270 [Candidatus Muiribacterium halophilum]|uniref:GTPase Obg n=1 Tax=Muiribacterium halophilum TaxID=2053465 RepID=A0A2N5Z9K2_MUIH1|nr:MAG: hypothetical protein C0601_13270 [Candidatus Muirbacterium halophilum]